MVRRALCVTVLLATSAAAAIELPTLVPSGPWQLDYGDTQCAALRAYGPPDNQTVFAIIPSISGQTYDLVISAKRPQPGFPNELEGTVDFGQGPFASSLLYSAAKAKGFTSYRYRIPAAQMVQANHSTSVSLKSRGRQDFHFELSAMAGVLAGLATCTADLQKYWNYGEASEPNNLATPSKGDVRNLFSADDYPRDALHFGEQGTTQFELLVDERGSVAACHVAAPSGIPTLDAMGCQVLTLRAKFQPAMGKDGKPRRSVYTTPPIIWRLRS